MFRYVSIIVILHLIRHSIEYMWSDNKVRELATVLAVAAPDKSLSMVG